MITIIVSCRSIFDNYSAFGTKSFIFLSFARRKPDRIVQYVCDPTDTWRARRTLLSESLRVKSDRYDFEGFRRSPSAIARKFRS